MPEVKHLEMIQGVVNRLASNSFSIKRWSIALFSALAAVASTIPEYRSELGLLAVAATVQLWGLDAYYLRQERLFRALYDTVRGWGALEAWDQRRFTMNTGLAERKVPDWLMTMFSKTLRSFYGLLVALSAFFVIRPCLSVIRVFFLGLLYKFLGD